jgi:hypothetical protein
MISTIDVGDYMIEFNIKLGECLRENDEMMRSFLEVIQSPKAQLLIVS